MKIATCRQMRDFFAERCEVGQEERAVFVDSRGLFDIDMAAGKAAFALSVPDDGDVRINGEPAVMLLACLVERVG